MPEVNKATTSFYNLATARMRALEDFRKRITRKDLMGSDAFKPEGLEGNPMDRLLFGRKYHPLGLTVKA